MFWSPSVWDSFIIVFLDRKIRPQAINMDAIRLMLNPTITTELTIAASLWLKKLLRII
jgi:hypothetical protein